jgi:hypothetical protein
VLDCEEFLARGLKELMYSSANAIGLMRKSMREELLVVVANFRSAAILDGKEGLLGVTFYYGRVVVVEEEAVLCPVVHHKPVDEMGLLRVSCSRGALV